MWSYSYRLCVGRRGLVYIRHFPTKACAIEKAYSADKKLRDGYCQMYRWLRYFTYIYKEFSARKCIWAETEFGHRQQPIDSHRLEHHLPIASGHNSATTTNAYALGHIRPNNEHEKLSSNSGSEIVCTRTLLILMSGLSPGLTCIYMESMVGMKFNLNRLMPRKANAAGLNERQRQQPNG